MLAIHDQFTEQTCDRLKTTSMGLGLIRLLQAARRFEDAHATLDLLENGAPGVAANAATPARRSPRPLSRASHTAGVGAA